LFIDQRNYSSPPPTFSILTVVKNAEKTVQRTLDSIRSQINSDFELIVVDGQSTDLTLTILKKNLDVIDCLVSEPDESLVAAWNKALKLSRGKIISILNADDAYYPDTLSRVADRIPLNQDEYVIYGGMNHFGMSEKILFIDILNIETSMIFHPSMFVSRQCFESYGNFDETFRIAPDYDFTSRLFKAGVTFWPIQFSLSQYQPGGISEKQKWQSLYETLRIHKKYFGHNFIRNAFFAFKVILVSGVSKLRV